MQPGRGVKNLWQPFAPIHGDLVGSNPIIPGSYGQQSISQGFGVDDFLAHQAIDRFMVGAIAAYCDEFSKSRIDCFADHARGVTWCNGEIRGEIYSQFIEFSLNQGPGLFDFPAACRRIEYDEPSVHKGLRWIELTRMFKCKEKHGIFRFSIGR
jgi:hypothetical protein